MYYKCWPKLSWGKLICECGGFGIVIENWEESKSSYRQHVAEKTAQESMNRFKDSM